MLKYKLDSESFNALNEVEQSFYSQAGEGYQLQVEGATDKSKLDEFRAKNVDLLKQQDSLKGIDVEKYREFEEQARKIKDKEYIEAKDFDGLINERTNTLRSDYDAKIQSLTAQLADSTGNYNSLVTKHEIGGAATKAFSEHKISPDAFDAVMSQIRAKFSIDNGQVVAKDGDKILTGADGNLTVSEFVASQPEIFKIQSSGGSANGGNSSGGAVDSKAKLRAAYEKQYGRN